MAQNNEETSIIQVKELSNKQQCFSFALPTGQLQPKHLESYLQFLSENSISEVMKSLLHIYFTARDDQYFEMSGVQRVALEKVLTFLTDHTDETVSLDKLG